MTVYLVDEAFYEAALSYSSLDRNARVVLLEDAVYSYLIGKRPEVETFALSDDISRRGLESRVPSTLHIITYDDLVRMMEEEKVINFL